MGVPFWMSQQTFTTDHVKARYEPLLAAGGIPVSGGVDYTFLARLRAITQPASVALNLYWFASIGVAASTASTLGTQVALPFPDAIGVDLSLPATSPANATLVIPELDFIALPNDVFKGDNTAFARGDNILWTPGGDAVNVEYIMERSDDGGITWEYLWAASRENPAAPNTGVARLVKRDRSAPLGISGVRYRVRAIANPPEGRIYSDSTEVTVPSIQATGWWLRDPVDYTRDVMLRATNFTKADTDDSITYAIEGGSYPEVQSGNLAVTSVLSVTAITLSGVERRALWKLLASKRVLHLQMNTGGQKWHCKVTKQGAWTPKRAAPTAADNALVRDMHEVSFELTVVEPIEVTAEI